MRRYVLVPNYPVITAITAVITAILVFRVRKRLSCGNEEKRARSRITCEACAVTNRVPASRASFASSCFGARSHTRNITAVTGKLPENYRISPNRESNLVTRYRVIRNQEVRCVTGSKTSRPPKFEPWRTSVIVVGSYDSRYGLSLQPGRHHPLVVSACCHPSNLCPQ